jgi:hypothetical protein
MIKFKILKIEWPKKIGVDLFPLLQFNPLLFKEKDDDYLSIVQNQIKSS